MLVIFFGVSNNALSAGRSPLIHWLAPLVTTLPAILPAKAPKRPTLPIREEGTARAFRSSVFFAMK